MEKNLKKKAWLESFEELASPLDDEAVYFIKCPDCGSLDLFFKHLELFEGNYILTFYCDDCHNLFSTRLKTGYISYNLNADNWEAIGRT